MMEGTLSEIEKRDAMRTAIFNRLPSPTASSGPSVPEQEVKQESEYENLESLGHLKKGLSKPGDAANRRLLYQQHIFNITVDKYFPRATFAQVDPGICSLVAATVYAEMHLETPVPPTDGPSTLEPMASMTIARTNGASNSVLSNTPEPVHNPTARPQVMHQVNFNLAQQLHVAVQVYCGGGSLKVRHALSKLELLEPVLEAILEDQANPLPMDYPQVLRDVTFAAFGEARTKAAKSLQAWCLLLKKCVYKVKRLTIAAEQEAERKAEREAAMDDDNTASSSASNAASSASSSLLPPPRRDKSLPPTANEKQKITNLTRLAINAGKASQARQRVRIASYSTPSNPEGGGDKLMIEEVFLRSLVACRNVVKDILNPSAPLAPGDDDTTMDSSAEETDLETEDVEMSVEEHPSGGSNAAASHAPTSTKKAKKKKSRAEKATEAKAEAMSDFAESGPSAKNFIDAVRNETNTFNLCRLLIALESKIKLVRAYNAARLDTFHHSTAMAITRACGINSCISNPRVEYTGGWKKMLKGSTTGSYMQMAAPGRFMMVLAKKTLRFATKLICPDETFTSI
jgi:hypothetical protein